MLPPALLSDREMVAFVARQGACARDAIGVCNGGVMLGAAGALRGKHVATSRNALPALRDLVVAEVIPGGTWVVTDGSLYTAGPGVGSFEAALLVAAAKFGRLAAEVAELLIEYDPHPPFGTGTVQGATAVQVVQLEELMAGPTAQYRDSAVSALMEIP